MNRLSAWWRGLSTRGKVFVSLAALIAIGAIGSAAGPSAPATSVNKTPEPTAVAVASALPRPSLTEAPIVSVAPAPTEPDATPSLAFDPIKLTGSGDKIARFVIPEDAVAIAEISYNGTRNFAVWTVDSSGEETDLLVNEIGAYQGTRLFDAEAGQHSVAFKVESSGKWTIRVKPISMAATWDRGEATSGKGDMVLLIDPPIEGFAISTIKHSGDSNFAVWAFGSDGRELLVNEIGSYTGEVLWPSTSLVELTASGRWSITAAE